MARAMTAVLFTCAGQRADIVAAFREAGAVTVAVDVDPLAPALYRADHRVLVPRVDDPAYVPALAALVEEHEARLLVPLTDLDHRLLVSRRDEIPALVLLPDLEVVERTADKWLAHVFFEANGIPSPPTWLPGDLPAELPYPVLVKPREGFGARNMFRAHDRRELELFLERTPVESMVQAACTGEEFSIDVFCDLEGRCLSAIPRTMIESKGGESIKGMSIKDWELIEFGARVGEVLRLRGPATIQCFRTAPGRHEVTDVNPRFGGAFPLPLAAGGRYPELALSLAAGERPEPRLGEFREGIVMTRFFSEVCLVSREDGSFESLEPERAGSRPLGWDGSDVAVEG
jgi:carbamoyl-phosphate synthase large subunit